MTQLGLFAAVGGMLIMFVLGMFPETDLVKVAEREVIEAAKRWMREDAFGVSGSATEELFAAVTLLEERSGRQYDPDHLNPEKGGNTASNDYW